MSKKNQLQKQPDQTQDVGRLLQSQKAQIAMALPKHMTADRMARIALTEIRKNPELKNCDPYSFLGAIIQCSQLGLEPGNSLGHAYLIPFRNRARGVKEVQLIPGYKGLIDLARRSGQVETISARTVHENDEFEFEYGLDERLVHKPASGDRGEITHAYAVAKLKDGARQMEVMTREEIDKIRDQYGKGNPVWKNHYLEMARKSCVRRLAKYLPLSPEFARAIEIDDTANDGKSQRNYEIIDADHVPYTPKSEDATTPGEANAAIERDNREKEAEELAANLASEIDRLQGQGFKYGDILAELGVGDNDEWTTFEPDQLAALIDAARSLGAQAANA